MPHMDEFIVKRKPNKNRRKQNKKSFVAVVGKDKDKSKSVGHNQDQSKPKNTSNSVGRSTAKISDSHKIVREDPDTIITKKKRKLVKPGDAANVKKKRSNENVEDMLSDSLNFIPNCIKIDRSGDNKSHKKTNVKRNKVTEDVGRTGISRKRKTDEDNVNKSSVKMAKLQDVSSVSEKSDAKSTDTSVNKDERTAFVGNLPADIDKKKLRSFFKLCGGIQSVRLRGATSFGKKGGALAKHLAATNKADSGTSKVLYGYVVFKHTSGLLNACKLNGAECEGCKLRVDTCSKEKELDTKYTVFLGNLPYDITDNTLLDHFSQCQPIDYVRVIRDATTGKGKGFGYVKFADSSGFCLAMKMNESLCEGRTIRVKAATTNQKPQTSGTGHETAGFKSNKKKVSHKPKHMARKLEKMRQEQMKKEDIKKTGITKASNRIKSSFPVIQPKKKKPFKKRKFDKTKIGQEKAKKSDVTPSFAKPSSGKLGKRLVTG